MKTTVRALVVKRTWVPVEVDHEDGDDPCDLTREEEAKAVFDADMWDAESEEVEEVRP